MEQQKVPYEIDLEHGTIRYKPEPLLDHEEVIPITAILDMFLYFKSREDNIRHVVNEKYERQMQRPLALIGGRYFGITEHGAKVVVMKADYDRLLEESEQQIREEWLAATKQERNKLQRRLPELTLVDDYGRAAVPRDEHGREIPTMPELTLDSCPPEIIYEGLMKRRSVDFWNVREENLTRGQWIQQP